MLIDVKPCSESLKTSKTDKNISKVVALAFEVR